MVEELKKAIQQSKALDAKSKEIYLAMINMLPEEKLEKLHAIFRHEFEETADINKKTKQKKSEINKRYLKAMAKTFKDWAKTSIAKEEKREKINAENILKEFDQIK